MLLILLAVAVIFLFFNPKKGLKLVLPDLDDIALVEARIERDTAFVSVDMVLENKSIFKLDLDTLFYEVSLADSQLFRRTQVLGLRQKPGSLDTFAMPLNIPVSKTMRTIRSLQSQDSTYLDIRAYLVYNTVFGSQKIPVSKKVRIKVPVPPEIRLNTVDITNVNLGDKTISLLTDITLINKGDMLDLNIHEVNYHVELGKDLLTSDGVYSTPIRVAPSSETRVTIPVTVRVNAVFKTAWKYVVNDEVPYHVSLKAKLDENSFYHKSDIPVEAKAQGKAKLRGK